nr:DUF948 domain-containing protein [Phormidium sp. FACHB-592]
MFWLVLSLLFVTVSLTIVLVVAIPALRELARASRSAEKLFDTLRREFPPTLQAIRLTGLEISDLTEDVSEGVQSAGQVVKQVDQSLSDVRQQTQRIQSSTRSVVVGIKAAWRTFTRSPKPSTSRRPVDRLPSPRSETDFSPALRESERISQPLPDGRMSEKRAEPLTRVERSRSSNPNPPAIWNTPNQLDRPLAEHQSLDPDEHPETQLPPDQP